MQCWYTAILPCCYDALRYYTVLYEQEGFCKDTQRVSYNEDGHQFSPNIIKY